MMIFEVKKRSCDPSVEKDSSTSSICCSVRNVADACGVSVSSVSESAHWHTCSSMRLVVAASCKIGHGEFPWVILIHTKDYSLVLSMAAAGTGSE